MNYYNTKVTYWQPFVFDKMCIFANYKDIIIFMENELRKVIAYNLRVERAKKDYTQEKLAELAGISTKHLTKIENENVSPSIYIIFKLATALGITVDKLVYKNE